MNTWKSKRISVKILKLQRYVFARTQGLFSGVKKAEQIFSVIAAIIIGVLGAFEAIGFRKYTGVGQKML